MPTVIFPNGKIVALHANNKCGISTVQSYLGYPFFFDMRGRNGKAELKEKGLWFDKDMGKNFIAPDADHRAAVIRDPVKRMTSIYTDRVLRKNRENCKQEITSWEIFVNELPTWQSKYKDILIHSLVQADVLSEVESYEKIFNTGQLSNDVRQWVSNHAGITIPPHKGKDGRGASEAIQVTPEQEKLIKKYYAKDYEVFGNYFQ
jgi:hypothetical protein